MNTHIIRCSRKDWLHIVSAFWVSLVLTCTSDLSFGQTFIQNYLITQNLPPSDTYPYESKNYSIIPYSSSEDAGYMVAGTMFEQGWVDNLGGDAGKALHFMAIESSGKVKTCNSTPLSYFYDDPDYTDERAITLIPYDDNTVILMAQVRDFVNNVDGVKFLFIDKCTGAITRDEVFAVANTSGGAFGTYPLDAILNSNNGKIYVVGYLESGRAMICSYDPSFTPGLFVPLSYNYGFSNTGYNFNKHIHIKELKGRGNGDMVVTGSCNITTASSVMGSGSLALLIDQTCAPISILGMTGATVENDDDIYEYAFDAEENADGTFFVYSNKFTVNSPMLAPLGYHPFGKFIVVTLAAANLKVPTATDRRLHMDQFDNVPYAWGTTVLETERRPDFVGLKQERHLFTGFTEYEPYCTFSSIYNPPAPENICPFVANIFISRDASKLYDMHYGSSTPYEGYWNIYFTTTGTTGFSGLGGPMSNVCFPTKNGIKHAPLASEILITAPKLNDILPLGSPTLDLSFKIFGTDINGDITLGVPICDESYRFCGPFEGPRDVLAYDLTNSFAWGGHATVDYAGNSEQLPNIWVNDTYDCATTSYFKPSKIGNVNSRKNNITVYPNPAHNSLQVQIEEDMEASVRIELVDVTGRVVAHLYEGDAKSLKTKTIDMSQIPQGLYILKVNANGRQLHQQKLVIE